MKRLLVVLVAVFAGALTASARVAWLPLTAKEIVSYMQKEANGFSACLTILKSDGSSVYVESDDWWETNAFARHIDQIRETVSKGLKKIDPPGTNKFQVGIMFEARYFKDGRNAGDQYGDRIWYQVYGVSAPFQFPSSGEIPPEAFKVEVNWFSELYLEFPVNGQGVRWVEWSSHQEGEGGTDIDEFTSNGISPYPQPTVDVLKIPIPRITDWEIGPNNWPPPSWWRLILWYDEGRTDGTEFRWMPGSQVVRREILPQQLSIALSGGLLKVTLTGGVPGGTYVLEPVSALTGSIQTQASILPPPTAVADTKGVAIWSLHPTGVGEFFRARLR